MIEPRRRPRRSFVVPGSNPRFLEKAKSLPADEVFLDLEDACAPWPDLCGRWPEGIGDARGTR